MLFPLKPGALAVAIAGMCVLGATATAAAAARSVKASLHDGRDTVPESARDIYIVQFSEPALALYQGQVEGLPVPARAANGKLDSLAVASKRYVAHLAEQQIASIKALSTALGREVRIERAFQHAINAVVVRLNPADLDTAQALPGVRRIEAYRAFELKTDQGPSLIGAPAVWTNNGQPPGDTVFGAQFENADARPPALNANRGEGTVIGVIDTGINFDNVAFGATDAEGYTHVNPLGEGNYLGSCAPGGVDVGLCNAKLIGAYDFVCGEPGNICGQPDITEMPGAEDDDGHGSHTASTVAGNARTVSFRGNTLAVSGVAPRANIVAFDACYIDPATRGGLCPNVATLAAVDQAVSDGVVDAINYSIGGGTRPWSGAMEQAFLGATEAGIFVAAAAGNGGPSRETVVHVEPWTTTVAASSHGRASIDFRLDVTGPVADEPATTSILLNLGTAGADFTIALPDTTPLVLSPAYLAVAGIGNDGCLGYPAGTFAGAIAVIRRGGCPFVIKAGNARAAGAVAAVMVNNTSGGISPAGTTGQPDIPVFGITSADGAALRAYRQAHGAVTARIAYPARLVPMRADVMAEFSSRGPTSIDLIKPDLTAPGENVLAAIAGGPDAVGLLSGTSMAAPHVAGAALLVKKAHPQWTPAEIKSALMTTADTARLVSFDGATAGVDDRGGGRVQVDRAVRAGLVMNETAVNYLLADPSITDGHAYRLNLPSFHRGDCPAQCEFTRRLRNRTAVTSSWTAVVEGLPGTVVPSSFTVASGANRAIEVRLDTTSLADGAFGEGTIVLTPSDTALPVQRLTYKVRRAPRDIEVAPNQIQLFELPDTVTTLTIEIGNVGGDGVSWALPISGQLDVPLLDNRADHDLGYLSTRFLGEAPPWGAYTAEDVVPVAETKLLRLSAPGFTIDAIDIADAGATAVTFTLYDSIGVPAGNPDAGAPGEVYRCSRALSGAGSAGLSVDGDFIVQTLDLDVGVAATDGCPAPPMLARDRTYWVVAHVEVQGDSFGPAWAQFLSPDAAHNTGQIIAPNAPSLGPTQWTSVAAFDRLRDFALRVDGEVSCELPSWLDTGTTAGSTPPGGATPVTYDVNTQGLAPGEYRTHLCVTSDDPDEPRFVVPVKLIVF